MKLVDICEAGSNWTGTANNACSTGCAMAYLLGSCGLGVLLNWPSMSDLHIFMDCSNKNSVVASFAVGSVFNLVLYSHNTRRPISERATFFLRRRENKSTLAPGELCNKTHGSTGLLFLTQQFLFNFFPSKRTTGIKTTRSVSLKRFLLNVRTSKK